MYEQPVTLGDLKTLVQGVVQHTRPAPADSPELVHAISFGYEKAIRTVLAVRTQPFQAFVDPFVLQPQVDEYDVTFLDPPMWRPHRLLVAGSTIRRTILFRYRALASQDFQSAEVSRAGSFNVLLYDVLEGKLPGTAIPAGAGATTTTIPLADASPFVVGTLIRVNGAGPVGPYMDLLSYEGHVKAIAPGVSIDVSPDMTTPPVAGVLVTPLRRRVLKIVPAVNESIAGRLWYQYRPPRLVNDGDELDPIVAAHRDMVIWYAASMLLQGVNDAHAQRWFDQAQEMRSECMQSIDPLSGSASEAVGSDLDWCD